MKHFFRLASEKKALLFVEGKTGPEFVSSFVCYSADLVLSVTT
jgi:hypothetical protein